MIQLLLWYIHTYYGLLAQDKRSPDEIGRTTICETLALTTFTPIRLSHLAIPGLS